jgi:pectate lyase
MTIITISPPAFHDKSADPPSLRHPQVLYSGAHLFSVSDGTNEEGPLQLTVQGNRFRTVVERVPRP